MDCLDTKRTYVFGGLTVTANFPFYHAVPVELPAGTCPEVSIELTHEDEKPGSPFYQDAQITAAEQDFYFRISDTLSFRIQGGRRIAIHCDADVDASDIMLYLVGSAWGVLCHQRGLLPLHCSAIDVAGQTIALTGASGVGKSTLAAGLMCRGHVHICDDVAVLQSQDNVVLLSPLEKGLKLWRDATEALNVPRGPRTGTDPGFDKYFIETGSRHAQSSVFLKKIYVLQNSEGSEFSVSELTGAAKYNALLTNIYREEWLPLLRKPVGVFQDISRLLPGLRIFQFTRPRNLDLLDDSISFLENHLNAHEDCP